MRERNCHPTETAGQPDVTEEALFRRIAAIIEEARGRAARAVNSALVLAYWAIGREIVLVEQRGARRAHYGEKLLEGLSARLTASFGRGFGRSSLKTMRQFYLAYAGEPVAARAEGRESGSRRIGHALSGQFGSRECSPFHPLLTWTHYRLLLTVPDPSARAFYAHEAAATAWSSRELERQIASLLYERLAASRDRDGVLALARSGQEIATPQDIIKDPVVLEFLGLPERTQWRERDLGQLQMYVNWFDRTQRAEHEARTIGIALCSRKNDAVVRMTLPEEGQRILAVRYETVLPTPREFEAAVTEGRRVAERRR